MSHVQIIGPREGTWLSFHGIPAQLLALGSDTAGTYTLARATAVPGTSAPPHVHTFDEGFYVLRGEMRFYAGNDAVTVPAGGFIQIRGGTVHYPRNETTADAEVLVVCAPSGFDEFQRAVSEAAAGPDGPFAPPPADIHARMLAAGARFGIDLQPDPALFQKTPEMTVRQPGEGASFAVVGDVYRFLVTAAETGGRYACWHATVFPGGGPPPHVHTREEEAFFILRGTLAAYDDGVRAEAGPGSLIILPRGSRHWFKNESTERVEMLILIAPAGGEALFREVGRPWPDATRAPGVDPEEIARLVAAAPRYGVELHLGPH